MSEPEIILPPQEEISVKDFDSEGNIISLRGAHIDNNPSGPFFAKNYKSCLQVFDTKQFLPLFDRPGCASFRGDCTMERIKSDNVFLRYEIPFNLNFFDENMCGGCNSVGSMQFVDCAASKCERYGHFSNDLTGWNETKCQYRCKQCGKYTVFVERTFIFIQSGYYELSACPFDTSSRFSDENSQCRRCTPDYWLEKKKDNSEQRKTWDGTCFCCGSITSMMKDGTKGYASGSGRSSSLYGVTFCKNCNLEYTAAEHD